MWWKCKYLLSSNLMINKILIVNNEQYYYLPLHNSLQNTVNIILSNLVLNDL